MLQLFKKLAKKQVNNTWYFNNTQNSKQQKQTLQAFVSNIQCIMPNATGTQVSLVTKNTRVCINTVDGTVAIQALSDDVDDISFTQTKVIY